MTTHDHAHDRDEHCHEHPGKHCHSHVDVHGDEACVAIGGTEELDKHGSEHCAAEADPHHAAHAAA